MPDPRNPDFLDLVWLLEMSHEAYVERFRSSAARRAKHWMLQRNAAVALGNTGGREALDPLERALLTNPHPIVRGHAAWAIGEVGKRVSRAAAHQALARARQSEKDPLVVEEIQSAITELNAGAT